MNIEQGRRELGQGQVLIVCKNCDSAVGYLDAGKQKDGTYVELGKDMHCEFCDTCDLAKVTNDDGEIQLHVIELDEQRQKLMGL